jgi:preprotein translocase subunit SecA
MEPDDIRGIRSPSELEDYIKDQARAEAVTSLTATLGEFTGEDTDDRTAWDTKGLQSWLQSRFHVHLSQNQLRSMDVHELEAKLRDSAIEQINKRDFSGIAKYLEPHFAEQELANWAKEKFNVELKAEDFIADERPGRKTMKNRDDVIALIQEKAREAYRRREVEYPVEHTLLFAFGGEDGSTDNPYAADYVKNWINRRYGIDISLDQIRDLSVRKLKEEVSRHQSDWLNSNKIELEVDRIVRENPTPETLSLAFNQRFETKFTAADIKEMQSPAPIASVDPAGNGAATQKPFRDQLLQIARQFFRKELTDLEQFVLIQILDTSWKDHLYAMDLLKSGIGLQAFAEKDPRVMYKKEGYRYFQEMLAAVRDKVTDLIFRARIMGPTQAKSAYNVTAAVHEDTGGYGVAENIREIAANNPDQQTTSGGEGATESNEPAVATKPITRNEPKVGRNDLCPCGSGKKYKKCCGVNAA